MDQVEIMDAEKNVSKLRFPSDYNAKRQFLISSLTSYTGIPNGNVVSLQVFLPRLSGYLAEDDKDENGAATLLKIDEKYFARADVSFLSINHSFQRIIRLFQWNHLTEAKWSINVSPGLDAPRTKRKREETMSDVDIVEETQPLEWLEPADFLRYVETKQFERILGRISLRFLLVFFSSFFFLCFFLFQGES